MSFSKNILKRERGGGGGGGHNYKWYSRARDLPPGPYFIKFTPNISFLLHAFSLLTWDRKSTLFISSSLEFYEANLLFLQNFIKNFARHYNSAIKCKDKVLDHPMEQSNEIKNLNRLLEKWLFKLHTAKPMMGNYFWITNIVRKTQTTIFT